MEVRYFDIKGLVEFIPKIFKDDRGSFFESFRQDVLLKEGITKPFVQDNQSFSYKNVLRGIHFQKKPHEQGKLIRVAYGKALDVAVDLRPDSATFGMSQNVILDAVNNNMFYIPEGFGHGFLALENCILQYKCTTYYHPPSDSGIIWNDPDLKIQWGIEEPLLSAKDAALHTFKSFKDKMI
ncbi:MAG: dTDP-4-dehydrorhamnose 3,5-epimerase [Cyclobacteriaceae bacterium]|nr:dTDP-4-dehydrorhamnose 3,5-epimerase [Cyclobacteriaceae bacterium]